MSDLKKKTGNILSNVSPPSELPSFITANVATAATDITVTQSNKPSAVDDGAKKDETEPFIPTTFSPAIPPSKDTSLLLSADQPMAVDAVHRGGEPEAEPVHRDFASMILNPEPVAAALSPITQGGSALFGWMKGAVSGGGILQKVAEKAKNSVDTIVTTLDPQMKEYINSGGDTEVIVASDKDDKVRPIREAFQTVFGKATVIGLPAQAAAIAAQPVGFTAGLKGAEHRINSIRAENPRVDDHLPVVAIENFVVELFPDQWFDAGVILLFDYAKSILLKTVTQMTPIPLPVITALQADTPADYPLKDTGFAVTVGSIMARNLNTPHTEWHRAYTSVPRSEMILAAAKTIATLYKQATLDYNQLVAAQAEAAATRAEASGEPSAVPSGGGMPEPAE
ncbi:protein PRRC1-like [Anopheles ziemanni]|uniref:protein PRRC1-like n=1 Tax=Anopheles coustani TaxID=139045 RepID=UPI00265962C4|nr:protein PRRC1-like [Anopheles coustani]XP_058177129.1 protein PRRC1-like [Anopheles ziemanni]